MLPITKLFSINYDGLNTKTYGGTTYLIHAAVGGSMKPSDFGINSGWGGLRTTKVWFSYSRMQMVPVIKEGCSIPMDKILKLIM